MYGLKEYERMNREEKEKHDKKVRNARFNWKTKIRITVKLLLNKLWGG